MFSYGIINQIRQVSFASASLITHHHRKVIGFLTQTDVQNVHHFLRFS